MQEAFFQPAGSLLKHITRARWTICNLLVSLLASSCVGSSDTPRIATGAPWARDLNEPPPSRPPAVRPDQESVNSTTNLRVSRPRAPSLGWFRPAGRGTAGAGCELGLLRQSICRLEVLLAGAGVCPAALRGRRKVFEADEVSSIGSTNPIPRKRRRLCAWLRLQLFEWPPLFEQL